jgi:hypothetical protein
MVISVILLNITMRNVVIYCLSLSLLLACVSQRKTVSGQGIVGEIKWLQGNLMPAIGDTTYAARAKGIPVQREIHIYKAVKINDTSVEDGTFFTKVNAELVKKIRTDKKGRFRTSLPSGRYSVFVLEQDRLFANIFDGNSFVNPVTVEPGNYTEIKISINYQAYY